jgi:hypothetical protein
VIELLYEALNSEAGIIVETPAPLLLRAKLYPLIHSDPTLSCISLVISPTNPENHLWLVRKPDAQG